LENRNLIYIHPHIYLCGIKVYSEGGPASLWWYIELYFAVAAEGLPPIFVAHLAHTFIWDFLVFETQSKKKHTVSCKCWIIYDGLTVGTFFPALYSLRDRLIIFGGHPPVLSSHWWRRQLSISLRSGRHNDNWLPLSGDIYLLKR